MTRFEETTGRLRIALMVMIWADGIDTLGPKNIQIEGNEGNENNQAIKRIHFRIKATMSVYGEQLTKSNPNKGKIASAHRLPVFHWL